MKSFWKSFSGEPANWDEIASKILETNPKTIYIGSDSQIKGKTVKYITVIAILITGDDNVGHGGFGWRKTLFKATHIRKKGNGKIKQISLRERLTRETWMSIGVAYEIMSIFKDDIIPNIEIHCDVASNVKMVSNKIAPEIIGLVEGQNFNCKIKPDCWASMEVADRFTK